MTESQKRLSNEIKRYYKTRAESRGKLLEWAKEVEHLEARELKLVEGVKEIKRIQLKMADCNNDMQVAAVYIQLKDHTDNLLSNKEKQITLIIP